jgi:hypothetical protein
LPFDYGSRYAGFASTGYSTLRLQLPFDFRLR